MAIAIRRQQNRYELDVLNIQEQEISDNRKNVNFLLDVNQATEYLNSLENLIGNEHWLVSAAEEVNKRYKELRNDIRKNANLWSYSQYCERLAYHYYNLASYFNAEFFCKHKIDLRTIKTHLEKCLKNLAEISQKNYSNKIIQLKYDAKEMLTEINEIYKQQNSVLNNYSNTNIRKYTKLCIALGNLDQVILQQCSDKDKQNIKQQIQNIQLLRVINALEDAITVTEYKNTFITVEKSNYLGRAYQLAGQSSLSVRYSKTTENLLKKILNPEATECYNAKEIIKNIISKEITENKNHLAQVKSYIEEKFHKSLSTIDNAYIERKYIKYCVKCWQEEITDLLKELSENKSRTVIQEIFNSLNGIQSLSQIPSPLKELECYTLLMENYELIRKDYEKTLINHFKKQFLEQVAAYNEAVEKELKFLNALLDFLSISQNLQFIILKLNLDDFCHDELSFNEFLKGIIDLDVSTYGANLAALQETAICLQQEEDLFLISEFKEVLSAYIKPVQIQEINIDSRLVIQVIGKNIVISEILLQLENKLLENSNIEEVRFVGADIIHIDTNLISEVWQGRNIAILTKAIKIHNKVTWDVSGKDNNHIYSDNAGTGTDGHGKQGKDGYPGESGGNVVILSEKIENPGDFTIISNGGKGNKGQDGGCGVNGKDGVGITKNDFDNKFPSVIKFAEARNIRTKVVDNTIENIKDFLSVKFERSEDGNVFIEGETKQGNKITFSYCCGSLQSRYQAFLLYEGSRGQPGGHGGEYGLGGEGGYAGEIVVRNLENNEEFSIIKNTMQGREGERGQGGLYGIHGKNGWDMGYLDYQTWTKTEFRGTNQKSKCTLEYNDNDNNPSDRVWCPYKNQYAGIIAINIEHQKQIQYEERKSTRQHSNRSHHAQAVRKKNISLNSILNTYSHHLNSIEKNTLQNLRLELNSSNQLTSQLIVTNQKQQNLQTMWLGSKRYVNFVYQSEMEYTNNNVNITSSAIYETTEQKVENLINELKINHLSIDNWFKLKNIELNISQHSEFFSNFEILKNKFAITQDSQDHMRNSKLQDIGKLLIDKYRFVTLQEIAKQLLPYQEVTNNIELSPEIAARYLVEKEMDNNISHPILGTLNQYLYENSEEQHENISKYCIEELQNTNNEALKFSIKVFVLEVQKSKTVHSCTKKYYDENKEFLEKQLGSVKIFFEAFKKNLSQSKHAEIYNLWIASIKDKSLRSELELKIQNNRFLKALYSRVNNQLKLEYDWDKCCRDQSILTEYIDYIRETGLLSESYRELLAHIFRINIILYTKDQDNRLFLQDNHNLSSKQAIYILSKDNKFIQLNINENYLKLEEERKKKDHIYEKILIETMQLKQKHEFDDYLNKKTFLGDSVLAENKQYSEEKEDVKKISEYFPEEERQQLKVRLEKITSQYIGQQTILQNILKRFSIEGKHVSYQELCYLINTILTFSIEGRKHQNIFSWIVAAYPQRNWIDEVILLQLENRLKRQLEEKCKWRKYLSKIENKNVLLLFGVKLDHDSYISTRCIEDILYLLSNILNETVSLEGIELSEWPYVLKEKYWLCKLLPLSNWQDSEKLPTASYYLLSMENIFGAVLVDKLLEVLTEKEQEVSPDVLTDIFCNFYNGKWSLNEEELEFLRNCSISEWVQKMQQNFTAAAEKERDITQLLKIIEGTASTSKEITDNLSKIGDSIKSICDSKYVIDGKFVRGFTENHIKDWARDFRSSSINEKKQVVETKMLAIIDRAIELKRGFRLRDTQRLTVLALLANDRNTLAQVSTGEGKSLIVVAASLMKALCGEKVDIITSSSVLAKRDAEDNRDLYSLFCINVSHNCSENIEKRQEAYSSNQVVYGDLSNFQRDYLLDKFYGKNILGDRNFKNLIVDEVDSMLLDKGNNMLYLSHDLAGLDKLESVYIYIWLWIIGPARDHEQISYAFDIKAIKEAVISDLYGLVKKEDVGKLGSELNEQQKYIIWKRLIKAEILDDQGKLLKESINDNELDEILCKILSPEFSNYKDRLTYLLKECIGREKSIHVPNFLKSFVEQHLESWINSAITAYFMKSGQDYVVDVDRTGTSPDRNANITILDTDTGTDQANSQWNEALHQFLQLKHGCKLSLQSLKSVFISNVSFFKLYSNLYGLTGTLGSQRERNLLREVHKVDFVTIPTAKSKQFHEDKPILCTGKEAWINHICSEVKEITDKKKRSVLIICETINDVELINKSFGEKDAKYIHTYLRDYQEFSIAQGNKKLEQGQIIIATNLAGRGTDIKITEGLREAGGLHVCLTYLPSNIRIEEQAFGRAARCGDKGSGQLIITDLKGHEYSNSRVLDLKKQRHAKELYRILDIKHYYETQITMEENCFKAFKEQYEQLNSMLCDSFQDNSMIESAAKTVIKATTGLDISNWQDFKNKDELKEILLQSCLDKWTFWLDRNSKQIEDVENEQSKRRLDNSLNDFLSQLKNLRSNSIEDLLAWVKESPTHMLKFGKYLSTNEKYEDAIRLFEEVIKQESDFSEAAHYYKAFVLVKKVDLELLKNDKKNLKDFKQELRKAATLLDKHSKFALNAAGIIGKSKQNNNESIIQIDAYEEQQKSLANLYYIFLQSIEDILGHSITPQSFVSIDITGGVAKILYEDLLREGILKKLRVKKYICEEKLKIISSGYAISAETLNDFLSRYKGRDINEKEFKKMLKKEVQLPSREAFWKLLIEQEVLRREVKYIIVNNKKLEQIDPSLLDFLKNIETQILEPKYEQVVLNVEFILQEQNNSSVFKKEDFIKAIGRNKYQILKERGILSFNRKANINITKLKSVTLPCYDSITLKDFTKINITKNEALKILAEEQVFKKKDDLENSAYELKIRFDEIDFLKSFSPIYENAVKGLLSVCFTYRIALQKIEEQLNEKSFPVHLQLLTKPHQSLFWELLEQKIIKNAIVTTENEDLEEKLKNMYVQRMTENDFKFMLSHNKLIPKECAEKLFDCLVEKNWIVKYNPIQSIEQEHIAFITQENIKDAARATVQNLYYINSRIKDESGKRKISLNFSAEIIHENTLYKSQNIDKTVEKILDIRLQLSKEDTIKNIINILQRSRSSLKALKVPDSKLKPFTELFGQDKFANTEEVRVFFLNGLDQLLELEEKKWTREMIINTAIVTAMGISQIAIGYAIQLYSVGTMTHVGSAFINEGVSDLFFAVGCLRSGYFSWDDYAQYKLESLMFTTFSLCVGAYLSRGTEVSHFGEKIAGPNCPFKNIANKSGNQLIKTVGWKVVGKQFLKSFALKIKEDLAFGLINQQVDRILENNLQALFESIASNILLNIEQELENHKISKSLERAYETVGEERAKSIVNNATNSVFTDKNCLEKFSPIAFNIVRNVNQGLMEAVQKGSKTSNKLNCFINIVSKIHYLEKFLEIGNIIMFTINLLNNLDQKINDQLNELKINMEPTTSNKKQGTEKDCESFKKEVVDQWKSLLNQKVGRYIALYIVSPILKNGVKYLLKYVERKMHEIYEFYKESKYLEYFNKLKQENKKKLQREKQRGNRSKIKDDIREKYHKNLCQLLTETKNPDLLADIVLEGIPMDLTCAGASTSVLHKVLREAGFKIPELELNIKGDNNLQQQFTSVSEETEMTLEGTGNISITIELNNNHYEFCGNSTLENNRSSKSSNDCLYEALSAAIPELRNRMTPEQFRVAVANTIRRDPTIRYDIRQGLHRLPVALGAYGGRRSLPNITLNVQAEDQSPYQHDVRGGWTFDGDKDVDLREDRPLSNKELYLQQAIALNEAIIKINEKLSGIGKISTPVNPRNFEATKYDAILSTGQFGSLEPALYPVEMETTVVVRVKNLRRDVRYKLRIDIDNPIITPDLQGPHGPHIGYDVISLDKEAPKGYTGHILINNNEGLPDRGRSLYVNAGKTPTIPITRLFFPPTRPNTYLERLEAMNTFEHKGKLEIKPEFKRERRGRSYPNRDF